MSERHRSEREAAVDRVLAPLAGAGADVPSPETIYWRAQARLALEEASRRRGRVLRPLRLFHAAVGVAAIVIALLVSVSPLLVTVAPGVSMVAVPVLMIMASVGAYLVSEAGPAS